MVGGLLMTTPSVQQTPSIQPDPVVGKLLPAPATSRREFPRTDVLALYTEIYDNDTSRQARRIDVNVRLMSESGSEVFAEPRRTGQWHIRREAMGDLRVRQADSAQSALAPGRYLLRVEAAVRGQRRGPGDARDTSLRSFRRQSSSIVHRPSSTGDDRRWTIDDGRDRRWTSALQQTLVLEPFAQLIDAAHLMGAQPAISPLRRWPRDRRRTRWPPAMRRARSIATLIYVRIRFAQPDLVG